MYEWERNSLLKEKDLKIINLNQRVIKNKNLRIRVLRQVHMRIYLEMKKTDEFKTNNGITTLRGMLK